jgi:hypothetical protein
MIMLHEIANSEAEMPFTQKHDTLQALRFG